VKNPASGGGICWKKGTAKNLILSMPKSGVGGKGITKGEKTSTAAGEGDYSTAIQKQLS